MEKYSVRVSGSDLSFSAIHLLVFEDGSAENLHGHSFQVTAEVEGNLDKNGLVVDFLWLKRALREILDGIDHKVLLPAKNSRLVVETAAGEVRARCGKRNWVFPRDSSVLLPIENATAELLAHWISARLRDAIARLGSASPARGTSIARVRVEVEESPGQSAISEVVP